MKLGGLCGETIDVSRDNCHIRRLLCFVAIETVPDLLLSNLGVSGISSADSAVKSNESHM